MDWDRDWRRLDEADAPDPQHAAAQRDAGFAYSPFACVRATLWLAVGGLLLFPDPPSPRWRLFSFSRAQGSRRVSRETLRFG